MACMLLVSALLPWQAVAKTLLKLVLPLLGCRRHAATTGRTSEELNKDLGTHVVQQSCNKQLPCSCPCFKEKTAPPNPALKPLTKENLQESLPLTENWPGILQRNMCYREYIGIIFLFPLLTTSKSMLGWSEEAVLGMKPPEPSYGPWDFECRDLGLKGFRGLDFGGQKGLM